MSRSIRKSVCYGAKKVREMVSPRKPSPTTKSRATYGQQQFDSTKNKNGSSSGKQIQPRRSSRRHKNKSRKKKDNDQAQAQAVIVLSSDDESVFDEEFLYDDLSQKDKEVAQDVDKIEDSSSEDDSDDNASKMKVIKRKSPRRHSERQAKMGGRMNVCASKIAIGSKVFSDSCSLAYQPGGREPYIMLEYKKSNGEVRVQHKFDTDVIREFKYYTPVEEEDENVDLNGAKSKSNLCYLVFRVDPTDENNLSQYSNAYLGKDKMETINTDSDKKILKKRYLLIEIDDVQAYRNILEMVKDIELVHALLSTCSTGSSGQLNPRERDEHIIALSTEKKSKRDSRATKKRHQYLTEETILVYPFEAKPTELDSVAEKLIEASGRLKKTDTTTMFEKRCNKIGREDVVAVPIGKTHMVTVRGEDYERLEPYEFLNDSLIDFWMKWISRKEDPKTTDIHIFTTQFFTRLEDDGPESVSSWTKKKGIDIFTKKFIFIPVNKDIHWSLVVIVNPGKLMNMYEMDNFDEEEDEAKMDVPFILLLDSLRAHNKKNLKRHLYGWLNFEAKRLNKFPKLLKVRYPFNSRYMPLSAPKAPMQDNSWDCGVFVCRYAYGILCMRDKPFAADASFLEMPKRNRIVNDWVTASDGFQFDMRDIVRLRDEIAYLIDELGKLYKKLRNEQRRRRQQQRKEEEEKKADEKKLENEKRFLNGKKEDAVV
uniref:Ubiquitin-like protease family profile domain-containing protein n=1 Tax=Chaetoceros debilis TaxID=122233 RepID=A0A7S3V8R4_9STRA